MWVYTSTAPGLLKVKKCVWRNTYRAGAAERNTQFRYDSERGSNDARQDVDRLSERVGFVSKYLRQLQDCFIMWYSPRGPGCNFVLKSTPFRAPYCLLLLDFTHVLVTGCFKSHFSILDRISGQFLNRNS